MDVIAELSALGFTEVEAKAYYALAQTAKTLTGYEIAKIAGVARPNVYPALKRLTERGAIMEVPMASGLRYQASPFSAIASAHLNQLQSHVKRIQAALDNIPRSGSTCRAQGSRAFRIHGQDLVNRARCSLDIGATPVAVHFLDDIFRQASSRGVIERFVCLDQCADAGCGACREPIGRPVDEMAEMGTDCFFVVRDQSEVLISAGPWENPELLITNLRPIILGFRTLVRLSRPNTWETPDSSTAQDRHIDERGSI